MQALQVLVLAIMALSLSWASPAVAETQTDTVGDESITPTRDKAVPKQGTDAIGPETPAPVTNNEKAAAVPAKSNAAPRPVARKKVATAAIVRGDRTQRPTYHRVRPGDWLSKIALRYGMSIQEISALNSLSDDRIDVGQKLFLRSLAPAPTEEAGSTAVAVVEPSPGANDLPSTEPKQPSISPTPEPESNTSEDGGAVAEELPQGGLTAGELVGMERREATDPDDGSTQATADVGIPTLAPASVNPLSRARLVLAVALVVLGLLALHPRSRALLANRLPALKLRRGLGDSTGHSIEVHASRRLGPNQQLLFFEVSGARLLVGVSDGRMDVLHRWEGEDAQRPADGRTAAAGQQLDTANGQPTAPVNPNVTPTVRTAAVTQAQEEGARKSPLTPSAEHLLDTWRQSVAVQQEGGTAPADSGSWWMEGATHYEQSRLTGDELETVGGSSGPSGAVGEQRVEVEESILATLRNRRNEDTGNIRATTRGTQPRPSSSHGGFRAAARLGRRSGSQPENNPTAPEASSEVKRSRRSGSTMSFQI